MHIMLDLETLSLNPNAVVTQIGFALFDLVPKEGQINGIIDSGCYHLDIESQMKMGRSITWSTIEWWLRQEKEAQNKLVGATRMSVRSAIDQFFMIPNEYGLGWTDFEGVWANGTNFDLPIIEDLLFCYDYKTPWHYRAPRDTRTLAMLAPNAKAQANPIKHSAEHDAINQAQWMQAVYATLYEKGVRA